jgi:hypothetical protein
MSEIRDIPITMLDGADTTFGGVSVIELCWSSTSRVNAG